MTALEINRLDKIARRSKRVGGAIAELWGGQYLCFGRELYGEKLSLTEKSISRVPYTVRPAKKVPILGNFGTISGLELLENEWVDRQGFLAESCVSA